MAIDITVLMDLHPDHEFHRATLRAVDHASESIEGPAHCTVLRTSDWDGQRASLGAGVVVGPGSPYEVEETAYAVIRTAREAGVPLIGT